MERSEIREAARMVQYRRNFVPGRTYFFTVTLDANGAREDLASSQSFEQRPARDND
jgi:hypothetical protein